MNKNKKTNWPFLLVLALLVLPNIAAADTVLRTGEFVTIGTDQVVENDLYAAAGSVTMSGLVREDMYVIGGSITQNGAVEADLGVLGGTVQVHAPVGDDVRVVAGEVVIADRVEGDLFVIGGLLQVLSSAEIVGDVFFYGGEATISGPVNGSVMGATEKLRVDASIGGNVDVMSAMLTLSDRANVSGDVKYTSQNELNRSQNAVIVGEVVRNEHQTASRSNVADWFTPMLIWLFAALTLYLFFRREIEKLVHLIKSETFKAGLVGVGGLILLPVTAFLLMITVLGSLIGIITLLAFVSTVLVASVLVVALAGSYLNQLFKRPDQINLLTILIGQVAVMVLLLVPVLGPFVLFALFILTLGGIFCGFYRWLY